jgi:hypothetical protein
MSAFVSLEAYPNMSPWSPAPWASNLSTSPPTACRASSDVVTPAEMSRDCCPIESVTPQDSPSNPTTEEVYPISQIVLRTSSGISTYESVVTSPATWMRPVVAIVSTATLESGSWASIASRMVSDMRSHTLSGCPSVTDSDVKG